MIPALIFAGYFLGSIPTGYLIGKYAGKIDIRQHGSGNVGATNVFRVMGKGWGSIALALDISKGYVASFFLPAWFGVDHQVITALLTGAAAVGGHTWPIWLKFRGGKGVATSYGVFLGIFPKAVFCALVIWALVAMLTRYVSVASLAAALIFPIAVYHYYKSIPELFAALTVSSLLSAFIFFTHRSNIGRLRKGTENKIGKKS